MSTFDAHFGFAWCTSDRGVAFGAFCGAPLHSVHRKIKKPCKVASLGVIDAACRHDLPTPPACTWCTRGCNGCILVQEQLGLVQLRQLVL